MPVSKATLKILEPYLEQTGAGSNGEWGMRCPLHDDHKRSASLNVDSGLWFCQACEVGGPVAKLIKDIKDGNTSNGSTNNQQPDDEPKEPFPVSDHQVKAWHAQLLAEEGRMLDLLDRRGIILDTLAQFEIGWDNQSQAYTIPVRDVNGELVNIRRYQLDPADDRRKIWSVKGWGEPVLYPVDELIEADEIIICEGEWDAMLLVQLGYHAITRTGAAKVWHDDWNKEFKDMVVYVCQDMDEVGQVGRRKIVKALDGIAAEVYEIFLPYEITEKHGKDITDYFAVDGYGVEDFEELMAAARLARPQDGQAHVVTDVSVLDSFDSSKHGQRMRIRATITGKEAPPFLLPRQYTLTCDMSAGNKCKLCALNYMGGAAKRELPPNDPTLLKLIEVSEDQVLTTIRGVNDIAKCNRLSMDVDQFQSVERVFIRPAMDQQLATDQSGDYTARRVFAVGRHDIDTNSTMQLTGAMEPNPKSQRNEFLAWDVQEVDTNIELFKMTPEMHEALMVFRPSTGQPPLLKFEEITDDLAHNVTKIYGRSNMHVFMDLVFHSALSFDFLGDRLFRGWLDGMIVGDTRTGKSEVAEKLRRHYRNGEMISCEASTFAGVVGGLNQQANSSWQVQWGSIPLNDRRIVILDEVSGLTPEGIAQMSSIRSSGVAELTKIRSEKTSARTRLIWLGNPRNTKMADYTFGVQAIRPLIGNNEDIARFDMAMAVQSGDISADELNTRNHRQIDPVYTSELCTNLLMWAWSRSPEQIRWAKGAEEEVLRLAVDLADRYVDDPPLVQAANIRIKLARVAVAMALRLFSSDRTGELAVVKTSHVRAAHDFLDSIYGDSDFGYMDISRESVIDDMYARDVLDEVEVYVSAYPGMAKALRGHARFKRSDLEDFMGIPRDESLMHVKYLSGHRMIARDGSLMKCTAAFQEVLRRIEE